MSEPRNRVDEMRRHLDGHTTRLAALRSVIAQAEAEAAVHETLLRLAADEELLSAVARHEGDDPRPLLELVVERLGPAASGRSLSIEEPLVDAEAARISARLRCGDWELEIGWDRERGFYAAPDTRRLRQRTALITYVAADDSGDAQP